MAHTKNKIATIKIGQKILGWDDEQYRSILMQVTGKSSSTAMTVGEQDAVIAHMKLCGFKPVGNAGKGNKKGTRALADDPQSKKIRALWLTMHTQGIVLNASEAALAAYCKRMTGRDALQFLSTKQASGLINDLKSWQKRELIKKEAANEKLT